LTLNRRLSVVASVFALALGGCGGSSNSSGSEAQATPIPVPVETVASAHHHHRRHHRPVPGVATTAGVPVATSGAPVAASGGAWPCDDAQFQKDQQQFASGALQGDQEVDVCGTVTNVRAARDTRSGLHGYYDLQVAPGDTIEIVCDLGEMDAPAWPWVRVGDYSYVQGRYYYDSAYSQGIDWTHHGTSRSWSSPGYVVVAGTEYQ